MHNEHTAYSLLHVLVTRGLPAISLCMLGLVMLSAAEAASTTITINDLTDTLSVSTTDTSGRVHTADCPGPSTSFEECVIVVTQPGTATIQSANFPNAQPITGTLVIGDPGGLTISDLLGTPGSGATGISYELNFGSDASTETQFSNLGNQCSAVAGGCPVIETGSVQTAGTVTWSDGSVDTINFQSDVSEVPEPSSFLLFLPGLAGACAARRFRPFVQPA